MDTRPVVICVTVSVDRNPRIKGIRVHRRRLERPDRTTRGPIPITTPARTLLDLAGQLVYDDLERAADAAFRASSSTPDRLLGYLKRDHVARCRGVASLRAIANDRSRHGVPESDLEGDAVRLLRSYGLPEPVRQLRERAWSRNVRFDLAYPRQRVGIELDGRAPHWGRDVWQADHDRDNATELAGWRVLRFTWWDIPERPLYVVLVVASALGLRPGAWVRDRTGRPIPYEVAAK
jgi:very-short-patch-repair endonuclease